MKIRIYTVFLSFLVIILFSGCSSTYQSIQSTNSQREIDQAQRLKADGDYAAAARIYFQLAKKTAPLGKDRYWYLAADSLYQDGDVKSAEKLADRIKPEHLSLTDRYRLRLLYGWIYLARDQPEKTLLQLDPLPAKKMGPDLQLDYHTQRANVFSLIGNHLESAREQILAEELLTDPAAVKESQAAIIGELSALSNTSLVQLQPSHTDPLSGWMALALILKEGHPGTRALDQRIKNWNLMYPNHPANIPILLSSVTLERESFTRPEAIGVILPLSGPYAQVGEAIRQGILIAQDHNTEPPVPIRFYNSDLADPIVLYRQVVADGANIIVGPLDKKTLKALATGNPLSVPVLGLNQLPGLNVPNLYQFGLNPEDEVEQAANSAWFDGYHRALVFAPSTSQGRRLAAFFSQKWKQLGGEIVRSRTYNPKNTEYDEPIKQLLNTHRKETAGQPKSEYSDRRSNHNRSEFIFLIALPPQARLIKPMFQYYNAGDLAVYGTSQVYVGHESPVEDQDLSGTVFCDIPWLFNTEIPNTPTLEAVLANWRHPATRYVRLMALGFDAYNLLPHLRSLESNPEQSYPGVTGQLSLTETNRIRRHLVCAEFQNGVPVPRSLSPHSNRSTEQTYPVR